MGRSNRKRFQIWTIFTKHRRKRWQETTTIHHQVSKTNNTTTQKIENDTKESELSEKLTYEHKKHRHQKRTHSTHGTLTTTRRKIGDICSWETALSPAYRNKAQGYNDAPTYSQING